jgi:flagellar assembly protein FliH
MGLLKSTSSRPDGASVLNLLDIEESARAMLFRAQAQADQMLAAARVEADRVRAAAMQQGKQLGLAEGLKLGKQQGIAQGVAQGKQQALAESKAQLTQLTSTLTQVLAEIDGAALRIEEAARVELLDLALGVAQRVCKSLGSLEPAVLEANVREAIRVVVAKHAIRISIHPSQRDLLTDLLPQLKLAWPQLQQVEVLSDEAVSPGGCVVRSHNGAIDATLDGQLERIVEQLAPKRAEPVKPVSVTHSMSSDEVLD